MKKIKLWVPLMVASLLALVVPTAPAADVSNKKEVLQQAHKAYYSLRSLGLSEFQASITPNWELVLKEQIQSDPAGAQAGLKMLNGLHFSMSLDPGGNVKVTHRTDAPPPNEKADAAFNQIYSGMDQAVSGFFATWSVFMLTSPFPDVESAYELEDTGGQYRLSYKDGAADVVTTMSKDLTITQIKVVSKEFSSIIRPQFTKTTEGMVLSAYDADYTPTSGPGVVQLKATVSYQETSGLELPHKLAFSATYDGVPSAMELIFGDYTVKMK